MSSKIIKINRGDSLELPVYIPSNKDYNTPYILKEEEDVVYFAILDPNQPFECSERIKGYTAEDQDKDGYINIKIEPNDTRRLATGVYYYTVKLQRGGTLDIINDFDKPEEVRTIIERTKFIVNE